MKTIIKNVTIVTMNRNFDVYADGFVIVQDGVIIQIGSMEMWEEQSQVGAADELLDGDGGILMPGMVNLHTHMGMVPFRGLGDDCKDRLRVFLLPMEQKAMDARMVYLSTKYAAGEMLLSGVTTVFDMYYFEGEAARAMDEMGIRGFAGETIMEHGACDFSDPREAIHYSRALMEQYQAHPRVKVCAAPHGTNTCSGPVLQAVHELDREFGAPFSLHTAELDYESAYFQEQYGLTPAAYLDSVGVLDDRTLAVHCIRMTENDLQLFAARKACVAHCIGSNSKAAKGVANVKRMRELGIVTGLGTDGPASGNTLDLFTQMKLCADFQKNENRDRSAFPAREIVAMATIQGANALGIGGLTGSIEVGKQADLVLVETRSPNLFPVYDPYSTLVYSANSSNVSAVFVAGDCLVKNKGFMRCDWNEVRRGLEQKIQTSEFGRYFLRRQK